MKKFRILSGMIILFGISSVAFAQGLPGYGMHKFNERCNSQTHKTSLSRKIANAQVKQLKDEVEKAITEAEVKASAVSRETDQAINELQQLQPSSSSEEEFIDAMYDVVMKRATIGALESLLPFRKLALKLSQEVQQSTKKNADMDKTISKLTFGLISADNRIRSYKAACATAKDCEADLERDLKDIGKAQRDYEFAKAKLEQLKKQYPALAKKYADPERRLHL